MALVLELSSPSRSLLVSVLRLLKLIKTSLSNFILTSAQQLSSLFSKQATLGALCKCNTLKKMTKVVDNSDWEEIFSYIKDYMLYKQLEVMSLVNIKLFFERKVNSAVINVHNL